MDAGREEVRLQPLARTFDPVTRADHDPWRSFFSGRPVRFVPRAMRRIAAIGRSGASPRIPPSPLARAGAREGPVGAADGWPPQRPADPGACAVVGAGIEPRLLQDRRVRYHGGRGVLPMAAEIDPR
jgi:hypothetical protein